MKICQVCGLRKASVEVMRPTEGGEIGAVSVCDRCLPKVSPFHAQEARRRKKGDGLEVEALLKKLLPPGATSLPIVAPGKIIVPAEAAPESTPSDISCPTCGIDFSLYRKTYMLGCPDCYNAMGEALMADIRKFHGATRHVGPAPGSTPPPPADDTPPPLDIEAALRLLRQQLEEAVAEEDFERAARLRDEIRRHEAMLGAAGEAAP
jgi:protein-arginine kinase activator protein McsA